MLSRHGVSKLEGSLRLQTSRTASEIVASPPLCVLLGNHSSGKSSFVNHLLGQAIQVSFRRGLANARDR